VNAFNIAAGFTRNIENFHRMQGRGMLGVVGDPFTLATRFKA
jgi:hypothetical protein